MRPGRSTHIGTTVAEQEETHEIRRSRRGRSHLRSRGNDVAANDNPMTAVVHAGDDDYRTNPAGDAGNRIACGDVMR
jgi:hypothetical protein